MNRGAISIGHPYGMSGARMVMHALIEEDAVERNMLLSQCVSVGAWGPLGSLRWFKQIKHYCSVV